MSDIVTQYQAVAQGAGFFERVHRGRLRFDGADALPFLQALLSADIGSLTAGQRGYSTYLTPNGRMLADVHVIHRGDHLIADVPASRANALAARFDQVIFTEDVRVSDVSGSTLQIAVVGALAIERANLPGGDQVFAVSTDDPCPGSADLFAPAAEREAVVAALMRAGVMPMSPELFEVFRIEAGRPLFGVDMTEETIPLEAGLLDRAISTTKGCYVGQEIIIRVLHRGGGRVAKRLVKLALDPAATVPPAAGTPLTIDGRDVGAVTSAVFSPASRRVVALGYVARDALQSETVQVGTIPATILEPAG